MFANKPKQEIKEIEQSVQEKTTSDFKELLSLDKTLTAWLIQVTPNTHKQNNTQITPLLIWL